MQRIPQFVPLVLLGVVGMLCSTVATAQIPTQCFEIESILVDACNPASLCPGSAEGENEMVRFITGPAAIAITDLEADWPNGSWRGLVQNSTTAALTAALNATIESCGELLEPPGGLIPPGSTVILITSTDMCVDGNSFATLADTVYLIFQDAGNTQGHFANSPAAGQPISPVPPAGAGLRTLVLIDNATGCTDTVTYVRELLPNVLGTYGGVGGESDGGTAVFSWPGVPQTSYVNFGCQAPFEPLFVQAEAGGVLCGGTGTVDLSAEVIGGSFTSVQWSGGTGTFGDANALVTTYTAGPGDLASVVLTLCAQTDCADPICGTVTVPSGSGPTIAFEADGPLAICPGQDVVITATGADSYAWASGELTASITVTEPGTYTVTGTDVCGTGTASIEVLPGSSINVVINGSTQLCQGGSTVLTASGADQYLWNTSELTPSITVTEAGTYSVTGSNACGSATAQVQVTLAFPPNVSIAGDLEFCQGSTTTLTASGASTYLWNDQSTGASITVANAGTYSVTGTNGCGTDEASVQVVVNGAPVVTIAGEATVCPGGTTTLTASGADTYAWSTGLSGAVLTVTTPGTYTVSGADACGSTDATITVTLGTAPTVEVTGDALLCPGGTVQLTASGNAPITWSNGATGPVITVSSPGLYVATATNACGSDNDALQVNLSPLNADFTAQPTSGLVPLTVSFQNNSIPIDAAFDWDFDDNTGSTASDPTHLFDEPGVYEVMLTAQRDGCTSTASVLITVLAPGPGTASFVSVPNVFTPNGDRSNDVLLVSTFNIVDLDMAIFNRWGQKVNELQRVGEVWDGRSATGNLVPDGTYFYTLRAEGSDGQVYELTGHISLLR